MKRIGILFLSLLATPSFATEKVNPFTNEAVEVADNEVEAGYLYRFRSDDFNDTFLGLAVTDLAELTEYKNAFENRSDIDVTKLYPVAGPKGKLPFFNLRAGSRLTFDQNGKLTYLGAPDSKQLVLTTDGTTWIPNQGRKVSDAIAPGILANDKNFWARPMLKGPWVPYVIESNRVVSRATLREEARRREASREYEGRPARIPPVRETGRRGSYAEMGPSNPFGPPGETR